MYFKTMANQVSMSDKGHCLVTWPVGQVSMSREKCAGVRDTELQHRRK